MSRIGKKPVVVPSGVTADIADGTLTVKGPKGTLNAPLPQGITAEVKGAELTYGRKEDNRQQRAFQGAARLISAVDELMETILSIA